MNINFISSAQNYSSNVGRCNFSGLKGGLKLPGKKILVTEAINNLDSLRSDMLRMTYDSAIDRRQTIFKDAQAKIKMIKEVLEKFSPLG